MSTIDAFNSTVRENPSDTLCPGCGNEAGWRDCKEMLKSFWGDNDSVRRYWHTDCWVAEYLNRQELKRRRRLRRVRRVVRVLAWVFA